MLEIILGQIPEAIYFAIFMILVKSIKEKRVLFTSLMIIEYILLFKYFPFSTWSHVLVFIISYLLMKIIYKDKCNITDVFTLGIASIVMILVSIIVYFPISFITTNTIIGNCIQKIILFILLFIFKNKLYKIENLYRKLWNRGPIKYKIKSTTFRALNLVIFNIMFYMINIGMITTIILTNWR